MTLLNVAGLRAGFGPLTVLHGVDLAVAEGSVTALFGLNGAGKSVLLKVVAGLVPARDGTVELDGRDVTRLAPEHRVALGMGHVPQGRQVFTSLSVEQNLRIGGYLLRRRDRGEFDDRLHAVYALFPRLAERRRQPAGTLSGGEQAALAVARALVGGPRIVLVDEPTAGLSPAIIEQLLETLLQVRASGVTMLLVEQNISFGLRLADTACLLQRGRVVYTGTAGELDEGTLAGHLGVGRLLASELSAGLGRTPAVSPRALHTGGFAGGPRRTRRTPG